MAVRDLRRWQAEALELWQRQSNRGIVSVVTGGGKTIFALACIERIRATTTLVVVPTAALLDQWWEETSAFFGMPLEDVNVLTGSRQMKSGTINLAVLNTAARLPEASGLPECFLIIDECHRAAAPSFRKVLDLKKSASLGLSATPGRQYDDGLDQILVPAIGPVIYTYSYADALRDTVIVPFVLRNVVFELEAEAKSEYEKLTRSIARCAQQEGPESQKTIALLLRRARVSNLSANRVRIAARIVAANRGRRILVFHEDIRACEVIGEVLAGNGVRAGVYHSRLALRTRAGILADFRVGRLEVLVTCRALDEGFNVPETEIGIVAASTATTRQRIQRLGRILRPAAGKSAAIIYTLAATVSEVARLKEEESVLTGVATATWGRA